mmetsp:Transcript_23916/g.94896  ORF Transcript_23916/g.94896 Transcript_23916/m.94896 type:complete len:159 (-) Transcript_23916:1570-2046(-)
MSVFVECTDHRVFHRYGCVIRGDVDKVVVGRGSNVQDATVIHVRSSILGDGRPHATVIGDGVTVGHSAILHAATCADHSFVGMQACLLDFSVVESFGMVGAGSLVTSGTVVRSGELWVGRPARKVRDVTDKERDFIRRSADAYVDFARRHHETATPLR